jgi:hypothetical protein
MEKVWNGNGELGVKFFGDLVIAGKFGPFPKRVYNTKPSLTHLRLF